MPLFTFYRGLWASTGETRRNSLMSRCKDALLEEMNEKLSA